MRFLSAKQVAALDTTGRLNSATVRYACRHGAIPGAQQVGSGSVWVIPEQAGMDFVARWQPWERLAKKSPGEAPREGAPPVPPSDQEEDTCSS